MTPKTVPVKRPLGLPLALSGAFVCAFFSVACGGAVTSGVAVGRAGQNLSMHAQSAPQGAELCALQDAVGAAPVPGTEKPVTTTCNKAFKSDQLWRRAMLVLGAYGESLATVSTTKSGEGTGKLEAVSTGVDGPTWLDVEAGDTAARDAVAGLVQQMNAGAAKGDPAKVVGDASPHVNTICDGLTAYLETQAKGFGDVAKEIEKKRASRTERRCGAVETRTICVSETAVDRVTYADAFAHVVALENNHVDAFNAVGGFCAAHKKIEEAAKAGKLSKEATYGDVVAAVKAAKRLSPTGSAGAPGEAAPAKK
jgi:hypothetical protein